LEVVEVLLDACGKLAPGVLRAQRLPFDDAEAGVRALLRDLEFLVA
jgi:hypothetical protein